MVASPAHGLAPIAPLGEPRPDRLHHHAGGCSLRALPPPRFGNVASATCPNLAFHMKEGHHHFGGGGLGGAGGSEATSPVRLFLRDPGAEGGPAPFFPNDTLRAKLASGLLEPKSFGNEPNGGNSIPPVLARFGVFGCEFGCDPPLLSRGTMNRANDMASS
eukprot:CAMPEP_0182909370 /NCGR_PEP_ID=MMETSP0034_2-20130328/35716_1 /TAXON_ID=156128 /ORGANISM="Nephroselmis pyriformis, Strain CCMP717" /LENGTH=160 /DNA_ID=CAMNT_0025045621 /DNA_START=103 /DNA_END=581 /DNA_ORIENTATION=+